MLSEIDALYEQYKNRPNFHFTREEFYDLWVPYWHRRKKERLAMCRIGDKGDYRPGNVRIMPAAANTKEQRVLAGQNVRKDALYNKHLRARYK